MFRITGIAHCPDCRDELHCVEIRHKLPPCQEPVAMFETSKEMQLLGCPSVSSASRMQWHSFTQTLLIRWFHIRYFCEDSLTEQILLTGDLDVLESINADCNFRLINVNLASPPAINGTDNWAFSPLRRVTTLTRKSLKMEELLGYEYQVDDGTILFEPFSSITLFYRSDVTRTDLFIRTQPTT